MLMNMAVWHNLKGAIFIPIENIESIVLKVILFTPFAVRRI
jgi:hypothetical protein